MKSREEFCSVSHLSDSFCPVSQSRTSSTLNRNKSKIVPKYATSALTNIIEPALKLIGIRTRAEWQTSRGRIDMLLETPHYIYVMELKLDGTPEQALEQIDSRGYAIPFVYDGRRVVRIGLSFASGERNIDRWIICD